jgi:hypothetical protein
VHEIRCSHQRPLNLHEMNNGYAVRDEMAGLRNEKEHEVGGRNGRSAGAMLAQHYKTESARWLHCSSYRPTREGLVIVGSCIVKNPVRSFICAVKVWMGPRHPDISSRLPRGTCHPTAAIIHCTPRDR